MAVSERVNLMMQGFMSMHESGMTIAEIANHFRISKFTIYDHLQEIADNNKVDRESLLTVPHKEHERNISPGPKSYINPEILLENYNSMISNTEMIIRDIRKVITEEEL